MTTSDTELPQWFTFCRFTGLIQPSSDMIELALFTLACYQVRTINGPAPRTTGYRAGASLLANYNSGRSLEFVTM